MAEIERRFSIWHPDNGYLREVDQADIVLKDDIVQVTGIWDASMLHTVPLADCEVLFASVVKY